MFSLSVALAENHLNMLTGDFSKTLKFTDWIMLL